MLYHFRDQHFSAAVLRFHPDVPLERINRIIQGVVQHIAVHAEQCHVFVEQFRFPAGQRHSVKYARFFACLGKKPYGIIPKLKHLDFLISCNFFRISKVIVAFVQAVGIKVVYLSFIWGWIPEMCVFGTMSEEVGFTGFQIVPIHSKNGFLLSGFLICTGHNLFTKIDKPSHSCDTPSGFIGINDIVFSGGQAVFDEIRRSRLSASNEVHFIFKRNQFCCSFG